MHAHTHTHTCTHTHSQYHMPHTHIHSQDSTMHMMSKNDTHRWKGHTPLKRTHTVEKDTHKKRLSLIRKLFEEVSLKKGFDGSESQLLSTHSMLKYRLCRLFEGVMAMLWGVCVCACVCVVSVHEHKLGYVVMVSVCVCVCVCGEGYVRGRMVNVGWFSFYVRVPVTKTRIQSWVCV